MIQPNVTEWDEAKKVPDEIFKQMGDRGYLAGLLGIHFPTHLTDKRVKSVAPEKWDLFHEMLLTDELSRSGSGGLVWNLIGGYGIGAPPLFKFGKKELVERIGPKILSGEKRICLAITEPGTFTPYGSITYVANLSQMLVATLRTSPAKPSFPKMANTTLSTARKSGLQTVSGVNTSPLLSEQATRA